VAQPIDWRATVDPDFDGDGDPNETDPDDDNDGMPDDWEAQYAPTLNPLIDDAQEDPDGDGVTNYNEFQSGTDPTDFYSRPHHVPGPTWALVPTGLVVLLIGTLYRKRTK
jgi:hypothetical protein